MANIIFIILIGLIFGSFLSVLIMRVPKAESIVKPASYCDSCKKSLSWYQNIPLISYIIFLGRCPYCKNRISPIYPFLELLTAGIFLLIYLKFGFSVEASKYYIFAFLLLATALTDIYTLFEGSFETGVIPVSYPLIGIVIASLFAVYEGSFILSLAGCAAGYLILFFPSLIYSKVRRREGMGEGDFIFFAMIGSFLGIYSIPAILCLSTFFGILSGIIIILITKDKSFPIPFCPMLASAALLYIFFKEFFLFGFN